MMRKGKRKERSDQEVDDNDSRRTILVDQKISRNPSKRSRIILQGNDDDEDTRQDTPDLLKRLNSDPPIESLLRPGEKLPSLPILADPHLLDIFWNNKTRHKSQPKLIKTNRFSDLEFVGDAEVNALIRRELIWICGIDNLPLRKLLDEHAKGNAFFIKIAQSVKIDEWLKYVPKVHEVKDWANALEAWIGAIVIEGTLWGEVEGMLSEVRHFMSFFLILRYRELKQYFITLSTQIVDGEDAVIVNERRVSYPEDTCLAKHILYCGTQTRVIGYEAWGRIEMDDGLMIKTRGFGITAAEARNVATSSDNMHSQEPEFPTFFCPQSLFDIYRAKWFHETRNIYNHDDELQSQTAIRRVKSKYKEWIKELNDDHGKNDDRKKTIAILHWYQSYFELKTNNHQEAYILLGYVLEYVVKAWPLARLLMHEVIQRLGNIMDANGHRVKYNITPDHRRGHVSGQGYLNYRWRPNKFERESDAK